jgi:hypothetical protein
MKSVTDNEQRQILLRGLGAAVWRAAYSEPLFYGRRPLQLERLASISGARSGQLLIYAGLCADQLHQRLTAQNYALLRGLYPLGWEATPSVYFAGRALVIESLWPAGLQIQRIALAQLAQHPGGGRAFTLGLGQRGETVVCTLNDQTIQNLLIAGMSGSGKTVALYTIISQLVKNERAQFVLADGKGGEGLGALNGIAGQVGPLALAEDAVLNALGWAFRAMQARNQEIGQGRTEKFTPLLVIFDEFDVFTTENQGAATLLFWLAKQGRSANVHLLCATQSPKQSMFGNSGTRAQFGARLVLRVADHYESAAALGTAEPKANLLSGSGDAYLAAGGLTQRLLVAYTSVEEARRLGGGEPQLQRWPRFNIAELRRAAPGPEPQPFTHAEALVGLYAAQQDWGRRRVKAALQTLLGYSMGSGRIDGHLRPLGQELLGIWEKLAAVPV